MVPNNGELTQINTNEIIKISKDENAIIWLLYRLTRPLAAIFVFLRFSPNILTLISLTFVVICNFSIINQYGLQISSATWILALLFDFIDGQVARITGKTRTHSFSFDHTGDIVKIVGTLITIAFHYSSEVLWLVMSICICAILLSDKLNSELDYASHHKPISTNGNNSHKHRPVITNFYTILLTFNSHSLLLFPLLLIDRKFCFYIVMYFIFISTISCLRFASLLLKIPRRKLGE